MLNLDGPDTKSDLAAESAGSPAWHTRIPRTRGVGLWLWGSTGVCDLQFRRTDAIGSRCGGSAHAEPQRPRGARRGADRAFSAAPRSARRPLQLLGARTEGCRPRHRAASGSARCNGSGPRGGNRASHFTGLFGGLCYKKALVADATKETRTLAGAGRAQRGIAGGLK